MARQSVIIAGAGFIVSGTLTGTWASGPCCRGTRGLKSLIADRIANRQAFSNERVLRLPRRFTRDQSWQWYQRALGM